MRWQRCGRLNERWGLEKTVRQGTQFGILFPLRYTLE
jgi:hypothetical protein